MAAPFQLLEKFPLLESLPQEQLLQLSTKVSLRQFARRGCQQPGAIRIPIGFLLDGRLQGIDFTVDGRAVGLYFVEPGNTLANP